MRAAAIVEVMRAALDATDSSLPPAEQDQVYAALLCTLPPPTEAIRDPRGVR